MVHCCSVVLFSTSPEWHLLNAKEYFKNYFAKHQLIVISTFSATATLGQRWNVDAASCFFS